MRELAVLRSPARCIICNTDAGEAETSLARLTQTGLFSASESRVLRDALDRFWISVLDARFVLCHGDPTMDNAMWHAGQVSALLELWLAHPEGKGPLEQWEPLRRLRSLADGTAGYLSHLMMG